MRFIDKLSKTFAIDFGSENTRVWDHSGSSEGGLSGSDQGRLIESFPSYLAIDKLHNKVLAWGQEAKDLQGRSASNVEILRPIKDGQIWDEKVARIFLQFVLEQVLAKTVFSPSILVSVSSSLVPAVSQITKSIFKELGSRETTTIPQTLAAAIGAGMPVSDPSGGFLVQLGSGLIEAGVISLGKVVATKSSVSAGENLAQEIGFHIAEKFGVEISLEEQERLLKRLANVGAGGGKNGGGNGNGGVMNSKIMVTGKNIKTGAPEEIELSAADIFKPVKEFAESIVSLVKELLTDLPPELTVDVVDKGVLLSGGLAQLGGLDEFLVKKLGVPVSVVDDPEQAVIKGMGKILKQPLEYV